MRVLMTGGAGFVGPYVARALRHLAGPELQLHITAHQGDPHAPDGQLHGLDVTDEAAVDAIIAAFRPTHLIHLAGISDVTVAARRPDVAWRVNLMGTLHCAWALMRHCPEAWLVFAGSGQVYGASAVDGIPLSESDPLAPTNDYGATKAAADLALGSLAKQGLRSVRFRPFNHTGPGQSEAFAVPSFAAQIARIESGLQEPLIRVGNLDVARDLLDVRDVAAAYARFVSRPVAVAPGSIFNLASGQPWRMRAVLDALTAMSTAPIAVEIDGARWRPNDLSVMTGDASQAQRVLDWRPKYSLDETLRAVLDYQRSIATRTPPNT